MFSKLFWKDALERAISTTAQVFLAVGGVDAMNLVDYLQTDFKGLVLVSLVGGGLSIVKAIAAAYKAGTDTASLTVDNKELK